MFKNYLKIALRNITKHKGYSFINIAGLAIGMACCILILLWVQDELSYDRFHDNADNLYRVVCANVDDLTDKAAVSAGILGQTLKAELPEVLKSTRIYTWSGWLVKYNPSDRPGVEIKFHERFGLVEPDFLEMFTFPLIKGDPKTVFTNPHSIIIAESAAKKYFGSGDPMGKVLNIDGGDDYTVTGVVNDVPKNSHLQFDFLIPFEYIKQSWGPSVDSWSNVSFFTYLLLEKNASAQTVNQKIKKIVDERDPDNNIYYLQPLTRIHLYSDFAFDFAGQGDIQYVQIFSIVAMFVLIIACINFMNLATARSTQRAKEIGMRKVVGANRNQLIKQFLGESVLITVISGILAIVLVLLLMPAFNNLSGKQLVIDYSDYQYFLSLFAIVIFTGILSGSYPALFLSAFKPVKVLKGSFKTSSNGVLLRKALVILQFTLSIILIIGTIVVSNQLVYIRNSKLGFEKDNLMYMNLRGELRSNYETVKNRVLQNPNVLNVTTSSNLPMNIGSGTSTAEWEGKKDVRNVQMQILAVDYDFLETYKMEMALGRFFSREFSTDSAEAIIVNEAAIMAMEMEAPLGKRFTHNRDYKIIGVIKNFHYKSLRKKIEPLIIKIIPRWANYLSIRINNNDFAGVTKYIENIWQEFNPEYPFEYHFLNETLDHQYAAEQRMSEIFTYFSFLGIMISCLGLFGLASFMAERRTKEIGIRKVLGASVPNIVLIFSKEFTKWVLVANFIAWPIAWYAMNSWLQNWHC